MLFLAYLTPLPCVKVSKGATEAAGFCSRLPSGGGSFVRLYAPALSEGLPGSCCVRQEGRCLLFRWRAKSKGRQRAQRAAEACDKALEGGGGLLLVNEPLPHFQPALSEPEP